MSERIINSFAKSVSLQPGPVTQEWMARISWFRRGQLDGNQGKPFPHDYETADVVCQKSYENGRMIAAAIRAVDPSYKIKWSRVTMIPESQTEVGKLAHTNGPYLCDQMRAPIAHPKLQVKTAGYETSLRRRGLPFAIPTVCKR